MRNKVIKAILIIILLVYSISLSGCAFNIRVGVVKTNPSNNEQQAVNNNLGTSIKESDFSKEKEKLLNDISFLSDRIKNAADEKSIQAVLEDYIKDNSSSSSSVYFADTRGDFYLVPNQKLPEDYDARTRPWYRQAIENNVYTSQYQDAVSRKIILTVSKCISKNNENIGVIGVDKFIESGGIK